MSLNVNFFGTKINLYEPCLLISVLCFHVCFTLRACPFQYDDVAAIFLQRLLGETQI